MQTSDILPPFFAMMLITLVVWLYMYLRRFLHISRQGIAAQALTTPEKISDLLPENVNNASNNLKNLFELPVLFYVVCAFLYASNGVDALHVRCAWAFVLFRGIHSLIHCTVNHVPLRFAAYLVSAFALWTMVIRAAALTFLTA